MASRTYTNADLKHKPVINSKSRVFTNKDLKQSKQEDDFIPDDDFVPDDFTPDILDDEAPAPIGDTYKGPTTYMGGFLNSLNPFGGGEALQAADAGAKGYLQGSILNLPKSLYHGAEAAFNLASELAPIPGNNPINAIASKIAGVPNAIRGMADTTKYAGARPEAFGEMMGEMTGQPVVLPAIAPELMVGIKAVPNIAGTGLEAVGRTMKNYQPLSTATGVGVGAAYGGVPGAILGTMKPSTKLLRVAEKALGKHFEELGSKLKTKTIDGKIVKMVDPEVSDGIITNVRRKELPPSNVGYYNPETMPTEPIITPSPAERLALPPSNTHYMSPTAEPVIPTIEPAINHIAESIAKPKMRINRDGTITDMSTGEVLDMSGKPVPVSESVVKEPFVPNKPIKNGVIKSPYELPKYEPTGKLKDYSKVLLETPEGKRITIEQLLKQTGSKLTPESILQDMGIGEGLSKYNWKIIG